MSDKIKIEPILRVVLYLRLSDEDRNKLSKDQLSESIKNQEKMLTAYALKHNWKIVGVFNDEDWSGSDATRPDFNNMIDMCKNGETDIVLCKTQARFARDMELVEKYIHNLFHQWNIRFVTIVDKIDNAKRETKKASQILGLTDEWYIEDTSLNIRKTLNSKRENGEVTASFAPYGWLKDPENKNHFIPDPITAPIVKRIFYDEFKVGYGLGTIAKHLNDDNIPSPYEYKLMNGCKLQIPLFKDYLDFAFIKKTGTYIVTVNFANNEKYILNNLVSFNYITTDMQNFNNKCDIKIYDYTESKIKIYYSEKNNLNINEFNEDDFILLEKHSVIPKTAKVIAVYAKELDRTHTFSYQFEVTLKENREHNHYNFNIIKNNCECEKSNFTYQIRKKFVWNPETIKKILKDEVNIGNLVQFKTTTVSYKNHTVIKNGEDKIIKVNNTHEALIDMDTWNITQERLKEKARSCKSGQVHILSTKVYCMNCNRIFCKCGNCNGNNKSYLCCKDKNDKWSNCDNKKWIREDELHNFVLEKINKLLNRYYDEDSLKKLQEKSINEDLFKDKIDSLEKELEFINKELEGKATYFKNLYKDKNNGILTTEQFLLLINEDKQDAEKLEKRVKVIKKELSDIELKKEKLRSRKDVIKKYQHISQLSTEIVNDFIDKIYIGNYDEKSDTREIKIIWNFAI